VLKLILGDDTMANLTSAINIQVDSDTKKQATDILNNLGLSMSTAINIFLKQVIKRDGIPFEIVNNKPNEEMLKAVQEVKEMISHPNDYPRYTNREDLKKALLSDNE
jgi:DNA-damage-inducible protein J